MSVINTRSFYDPQQESTQTSDFENKKNRTFDEKFWTRPEFENKIPLPVGQYATFAGALTGVRATTETYLQGKSSEQGIHHQVRGMMRDIPKELDTCGQSQTTLIDMRSQLTREKKPVDNISEVDRSKYHMYPENFKPGYVGFHTLAGTHKHSRMFQQPTRTPGEKSSSSCSKKSSFGHYQTKSLAPYH